MRHFSAVVAVAAALAAPATASVPGAIIDVATGERLSREALADALSGADIAVLGEVHDNPVHHRRQAWLIERLAPDGAAFEMIPEDAEPLPPPSPDRVEALPELLDWQTSGWPDWSLYRPVFAAAEGAVLTAGGVDRDALRVAIAEGAAAAHGEGAAEAGLSQPLAPAVQAEMEDEMVAAHCDALPPEMAPGMVEAQRLRDARLAAAALRALDGGERAVLITGNGHARSDRGVPAVLARLAPEKRVLSLGQIEVGDTSPLPYDFVWYSEAAEREDPCAGFAVD